MVWFDGDFTARTCCTTCNPLLCNQMHAGLHQNKNCLTHRLWTTMAKERLSDFRDTGADTQFCSFRDFWQLKKTDNIHRIILSKPNTKQSSEKQQLESCWEENSKTCRSERGDKKATLAQNPISFHMMVKLYLIELYESMTWFSQEELLSLQNTCVQYVGILFRLRTTLGIEQTTYRIK